MAENIENNNSQEQKQQPKPFADLKSLGGLVVLVLLVIFGIYSSISNAVSRRRGDNPSLGEQLGALVDSAASELRLDAFAGAKDSVKVTADSLSVSGEGLSE